MNPHNYESWVDPNGGEWIRLKSADVKDVVWRPTDIHMTEDGRFGFDVEFFDAPETTPMTEENQDAVARNINAIMSDMIAYEKAQLEILAEEAMKEEDEVQTLSDDLLKHISENEMLEGGHKVSEALLPQDVQSDLAQISSVLGGLAPK